MAKLLTKALRAKMEANWQLNQGDMAAGIEPGSHDLVPVAKFFTPDGNCTWLITEFDPQTGNMFGLCDLGHGSPELGYINYFELQKLRGKMGLPVERERYSTITTPLSKLAEHAMQHGRIIL